MDATDIREIYWPIVRLAVHYSASSIGFIVILVAALVPFYAIKFLVPAELAASINWNLLELAILYVDIFLYGLTVVLWTIVFIVEEVRAVRKLLSR
ncbi:MAG TPA: hypothetical protein VK438_14870 [Xanthobacteraceae bacterium]|nr:hypothetical protein [Xanthobacteraceae bacterium]